MTETGTYSGDPSSDPDKNLPFLSEKQEASVLVKIYVSVTPPFLTELTRFFGLGISWKDLQEMAGFLIIPDWCMTDAIR